MKQCPVCYRNYNEEMNFCLEDGALLTGISIDTLVIDSERELDKTLIISNRSITRIKHSKLNKDIFDTVYELEYVNCNLELEDLHKFCEESIGPHFASLEQWKDRYKKNPYTFFRILRIGNRRFKKVEELTGMFSIIPVHENARNLLEQNQLNATTFTNEHIVSQNEKASAVYVSGLIGSTHEAKGYVISHLLNQLKHIHEGGINLIYTRPMTKDGLRIANRYGFRPVKSELFQADCIFKRNMLEGKLR